jgi:hypothetical protein
MDAKKPAGTKQRLWFILVSVIVLLLGWLLIFPSGPKEPSYQGRKLSEWLIDHETAADPKKFPDPFSTLRTTEHAVAEIGTNAIPIDLQWLQTKDSPTKATLNQILDKQHFILFRFRLPEELRYIALVDLYLLGSNALPAVPSVTRYWLHSPGDHRFKGRALGIIVQSDLKAKTAVPQLLEVLQDTNEESRMHMAGLLDRWYPDEAEKAGVYKMYPQWKHPKTNTALPSAK